MKHFSKGRLAEILKNKRAEKIISQTQLSELTSINRAMLSRMERQDYIPTVLQLEVLARTLEFDILDLWVENTMKKRTS